MTSREIKEEFTEVESANDNPYTICRLCMSEELLEDVFKENGVCQWISYYLSIMISTDDVLSHVICTICRIRLVEFHQFRLRCQEVQTVLKAKLPKEAAKGLKARRDKPSIASTQCSICKKQFNDKKALWNHRRMHKPKKHMCTSCDKSFALRSALIRHMQTHENERFRKQMEIWNSLANTANESDPLRCKICQIKFLTEQKYIIHQKHVHGPNRHVCDVCNFKCSMKCDLYSHFRTTAHLRKIGKLPSTDTQVTTPDMNIRSIGSTRVQEIQEMCEDSDLRSIIGRPHSQNGDDDQVIGVEDKDLNSKSPLECDICHKTYLYKKSLRDHRNTHELAEFTCHICQQMFASRVQLKKHLFLHDLEQDTVNMFHCEICQRTFDSKRKLTEHKKHMHKARKHICNKCGKGYVYRSRLVMHMQTHKSNPNKKRFPPLHQMLGKTSNQKRKNSGMTIRDTKKCTKCPKVFQSITSLWFHHKHSHKPKYKCTMCYGAFTSSTLLDRHKRTKHRQAEGSSLPMECVPCNKVFTTTSQRTSHILKHMPRKRSCQICNKQFLSANRLLNHVKMIHNADSGNDSEDNPEPVQNTNVEVIVKDEPVEICDELS